MTFDIRVLLHGDVQTQISHGIKTMTAEVNNVDCVGKPFILAFTGMPLDTKQHKHGAGKPCMVPFPPSTMDVSMPQKRGRNRLRDASEAQSDSEVA